MGAGVLCVPLHRRPWYRPRWRFLLAGERIGCGRGFNREGGGSGEEKDKCTFRADHRFTPACAWAGEKRVVHSQTREEFMNIVAGFCLALIVVMNSSADAEIFKWVDKNGSIHFSDRRPKDNSINVEAIPKPFIPQDAPLADTTVKKNYEPCGISLKSISKVSGFPGDTIELLGQWGDSQGEKLPCINKDKSNDLEVISWSDSIVKVKIPQGLDAGIYSVGVYCNDLSKGGSYSSGWVNFEIF